MFQANHLLSIASLSDEDINFIMDETANIIANPQSYIDIMRRERNSTINTQVNLFVENSTRTARSFEIAGKMLGLHVIDLAASASSFSKGETLLDTARTLQAMNPKILVIRHPDSGA